MEFNTIQILAFILIVIVAVKITIILIDPNIWYRFIEKLYTVPQLVSIVGLVLSILVLYFLINAGISIVEILAVCLFIALLMLTGLANYADQIIGWAKEQDITYMLKRLWIYTLVWVLLIAWGIKALFFNDVS